MPLITMIYSLKSDSIFFPQKEMECTVLCICSPMLILALHIQITMKKFKNVSQQELDQAVYFFVEA